ncbi:hypothetical protein [Streptomyces sp. DH37]|uniref:hypothetical protein n=1 Tax=Streptomyces sp. DH37 TaxID=3040122 RepID=UPI0024411CA1|nr:hypothetical protein [Streptomyces sp. DH37]MDG9703812.1 hypothetical protein [Streptomyces sp. DH37]
MAADLPPYPDVEDLLIARLADLGPTGSVYPANLHELLFAGVDGQEHFIRIRRVGGEDDLRTDRPRVDIEIAAATRAIAWRVARAVQQRMISGPARVPGVGVMDRARTEVGLRAVLHENPAIRCVLATYRASLRRSA